MGRGKTSRYLVRLFILFLSIITVAFFFSSIQTNAASTGSSDNKVNVKLKMTNNGSPSVNQIYAAVNLSTAKTNIEKGKISDAIITSADWASLSRALQGKPNGTPQKTLNFGQGLVLGKGITHSPSESETIINSILEQGDIPLAMSINDTTMYTSSGDTPSNIVKFHYPGNGNLFFTNNDGEADASINTGYTAIMTMGATGYGFIKGFTVTNQTKNINVDLQNIDNKMNFSISGVSSVNESFYNDYSVGYDTEVTFKLKIDKSFLTENTEIRLFPSTNLNIDSISVPNNQVKALPDKIDLRNYASVSSNYNQASLQVPSLLVQAGRTILTKPMYYYDIQVPTSNSDYYVTIKAHIASTTTLDTQAIYSDIGNPISVKIPVNSFESPTNSFSIYASGRDANGNYTSAYSPSISAQGINFVMIDGKEDQFVQGSEYVLGKESGNQKYLYSNSEGWVKENNLNNSDRSKFMVMKGGNLYALGLSASQPIGVNSGRFNFNYQTAADINKSLIKLVGLAQGEKYFLYQIAAPKGYSKDTNLHYFKVYQTFGLGPDGQALTKNSIGYAQDQSYSLNGSISDFAAGINEYNALSVSGAVPTLSPIISIIIPIVIFIIVLIAVGIIMIIKG